MAFDSSSEKTGIINKYQTKAADTGSPEVQVALLTKRLEILSGHFQTHAKDKHSRRGMMKLISRRKRLLEYLKGENIERYRSLISSLGLRKQSVQGQELHKTVNVTSTESALSFHIKKGESALSAKVQPLFVRGHDFESTV